MTELKQAYMLGSLTLSNRTVMAPMTRNRAPGTVPNGMMARYYEQRAGAGLIVAEMTQVAPIGQGYPDTPGIHDTEQVEAWREITDAVHGAGGHIFLQLGHTGRISHPDVLGGVTPVAPSALRPAGQVFTGKGLAEFVTPRELTTGEIADVVEQFRKAAANAREAGFDGVELHGANGYLINQFLDSSSNRRTDAYGGSPENRARFLLEVTAAAAAGMGGERVGVRLSPGGTFNDVGDADPEKTYGHAVRELNRLGLGYLHIVNSAPGVAVGTREGRPIGALALARPLWDGTLIATGGYDGESAEAALRDGQADLIGFARLYLANPDLLERFRLGAELNPEDRATFYGGGRKGYVDYPALARAA